MGTVSCIRFYQILRYEYQGGSFFQLFSILLCEWGGGGGGGRGH